MEKEGKSKIIDGPSNEILDSACQVALVNRSGQINHYSMEGTYKQRKRLIEHGSFAGHKSKKDDSMDRSMGQLF